MRLTSTVVLLATLVTPAAAQQVVNDRRAAPHTGAVRINNLIGSTRIIGWAKDSVWTSGTVPAGGGRFYAASGPNSKMGVDAPDNPATPGTDLVIYVPSASRVWVKAATASVDVSDVTGSVDVSSVSGAIHISGAMDQLNVESMDGDVTLMSIAPWLRAHTASGAIKFLGRSEDLGVTTVSGIVTISGKGGVFRRMHVESVAGDVQFDGELASDAKVEIETHSGTVGLQLLATLAAGFDLSTLQGSIFNQFGSGANAVTHTVRGAEAVFTVGGAGAEVKVRSFKGNIVVKRRKAAT